MLRASVSRSRMCRCHKSWKLVELTQAVPCHRTCMTFSSGADHATGVPFPQNVSILEEPAEPVNVIPQEWVR